MHFAALVCLVAAQQAPSDQPLPAFEFGRTAGVSTGDDGRPLAIGPRYLASFDASGATFVPALGSSAPRRQDLVFEARELRRGEAVVALTDDEPEARGDVVVYERAPGVEERFEATLAGLEHSLLVDGPVGTDGDLVVRIDLGGEVGSSGSRGADGSHRFARQFGDDSSGGVTYGRLFGIDANGTRCDGDVRLVPGGLELVLPASFVDVAAWPILLDPVISAFELTQPIGGNPPAERDTTPAVAFDGSANLYLVAWVRHYANGDTLMHGQRFGTSGLPSGAPFALSTVPTVGAPRVANVNSSNRFVVTWHQDVFSGTALRARAVAAVNGALSNTLTYGTVAQGTLIAHDLGGESHVGAGITPQAFSVWSTAAGGVQMTRIEVPSGTASISVIQTTTIAADPGVFESVTSPVISRSPSVGGQAGVAWVRVNGLSGTEKLYATVVDRAGVLVYPAQLVSGSDENVLNPDIDGGGIAATQFAVVWCDEDPNLALGNARVRAASVSSGAGALTVGGAVSLSTVFTSDFAPTVGCRPGSATIAYSNYPNLMYRRVHPTSFVNLSPTEILAHGMTSSFQNDVVLTAPQLCMNASGGNVEEHRGVVVWTRSEYADFTTGPLFEQDVRGAVISAFEDDATAVNIGGGCGSVGAIAAPQKPAIGNATFELWLDPAPGATFAILNIAPPQVLSTCGTCSFALPATLYFVPLAGVSVSVALPIPSVASLAGAQALAQWYVLAPSATPCGFMPGFGATDVLELTVN